MIHLVYFCLFCFFVYSLVFSNPVEGMENNNETKNDGTKNNEKTVSYENYKQNAYMLGQQNAGNIEYLKQRINALQELDNKVTDLSGNVTTLQNQMEQISAAQQQYLNDSLNNGTPVAVSGLE